ncbi:phage minor head protein [Pararhizobium sp.]|uniref:phage head morphogenesis protein n=1 Tax=Pararhizobium sp. TaxID=1977563 RepID=UPI003D13E540
MGIEIKPLAPKDAIAAYEARRGRLTESFSWQDLFEAEHATQFTVAKSAGFDVLGDIDAAMVRAIAEGRTLRQFSKELQPVLEAKGWWGKKLVTDPLSGDLVAAQLGSTRRLETIFNVNMRVSYAAGHWASFERNKVARPFLRYVTMADDHVRPLHKLRHNLVLPVDHPYWNLWAPPCGWGCRCTLQSLSQRDIDRLQRQGEKLNFDPPENTFRNFVNRRTGEIVRVPDGIDPGWAYNPGKEGYSALKAAEKLINAPVDMAAQAARVPDWLQRPSASEFPKWFDEAAGGGAIEPSTVVAGVLDREVLTGLRLAGIEPQSAAITLSAKTTRHMLRDFKGAKGRSVPMALLRQLPELIADPQAVLLDLRDNGMLYVFGTPGGDRGKIVVRLDFAEKVRPPSGKAETIIANSIRTAGTVERHMLLDVNFYRVIWGVL